jgi:hypothetical protein
MNIPVLDLFACECTEKLISSSNSSRQRPNADPVTVVSPGKRPSVRSNSRYGQQVTFACAEREVFDVEAEIDRQPLAVRPRVVRAVNDRRVSITIVIGKLRMGIPAKRGL